MVLCSREANFITISWDAFFNVNLSRPNSKSLSVLGDKSGNSVSVEQLFPGSGVLSSPERIGDETAVQSSGAPTGKGNVCDNYCSSLCRRTATQCVSSLAFNELTTITQKNPYHFVVERDVLQLDICCFQEILSSTHWPHFEVPFYHMYMFPCEESLGMRVIMLQQ